MVDEENMFGKKRGRFDEIAARAVVRTIEDELLMKLLSLSDEDLRSLGERLAEATSSLSRAGITHPVLSVTERT